MIKIYDTMSRDLRDFVPIEDGKVKMYVCGPTVYNYIHVGNARSTVAFDTIRRYFEYRGYEVAYISNFTDVDDKIINRAKEEGITPQEVADKYIAAFREDVTALGVKPATRHPRVVEFMADIIRFVSDLIEKGYAYESQGDVYFRVEKSHNYAKLANKTLEDLELGASGRTDEETARKENPVDFALWKAAKPGEISWDSPWGPGRPGWHIECSVMSTEILGDTIDIHGGGQDLAFPHHENEIAQSESKTGKKFANYWMHNAFVTMGEEKMSKSLGNFVLVHDLIQQLDPQVLRFFLASAHYRRPLKFSEAALQEAAVNLEKVQTTFKNARYRLETAVDTLPEDAERLAKFEAIEAEFQKEMDDDFNAANGMTVLYQWLKEWNVYLEQEVVSKAVLEALLEKATVLFGIFGIVEKQEALLDEAIQALIDERLEARKAKNFARSDEIRDLLKEQGIVLEDTPQGTRWRREA